MFFTFVVTVVRLTIQVNCVSFTASIVRISVGSSAVRASELGTTTFVLVSDLSVSRVSLQSNVVHDVSTWTMESVSVQIDWSSFFLGIEWSVVPVTQIALYKR